MSGVWQEIFNSQTGETIYKAVHPTGLPIFVCPKKGYCSTYAVFGTKYGSIDTAFYADGGSTPTEVPAGIAHYLEHKLFENEDSGAFERYAKTGASANAYTSFDRTAYLFSCTENFVDSLEILLDFVQAPYFTEENVRKEQGIIGQEIQMGLDSPFRRVFYNLLKAMYHKHPIRIEIAGTLESIAQITPELLYGCYYTFYNLHNMVLVVAGNADKDEVLSVADRCLKPSENKHVKRAGVDEPAGVVQKRIVQKMPVAKPLFYLGFKDYIEDGISCRTAGELACANVLLEVLAGRASNLYNRLMENGLINSSFDADYFDGPGFGSWIFAGESADPDRVAEEILREIDALRREGIGKASFEAAKKALYGRQVAALNDIETIGDRLVADYFAGREPFSAVDAAAAVTLESVENMLKSSLKEEQMAISIVSPEI
ncbi:MAG TPA: pitrilysin family protein [Candidatus Avimonas sp.]|nr:pitrilysin family protein [Candidatus Avimonas sp.]